MNLLQHTMNYLHRAAQDVGGIVRTACIFTDSMLDVAAMGVLLDA